VSETGQNICWWYELPHQKPSLPDNGNDFLEGLSFCSIKLKPNAFVGLCSVVNFSKADIFAIKTK
jgi:hypothetical protein